MERSTQGSAVAPSPPVIPTPPMDMLIPRATVAESLGVCEHTLRLWERHGRGPRAMRIGRRVYYRDVTLRRWLIGQEEIINN